MAAALAAADDPLLAELARWAARQQPVLRMLLHKMQKHPNPAWPDVRVHRAVHGTGWWADCRAPGSTRLHA